MSATYTKAQVAEHNKDSDCWVIVRGKVYAIPQDFLEGIHPGGPIIGEKAGQEATDFFDDAGHSEHARERLQDFLIGTLAQ